MSVTVTKSSVYLRDKTTQKLEPFAMIGSGASESLASIKEYADSSLESFKTAADAKTQECIEEIQVDIKVDFDELDKRVSDIEGKENIWDDKQDSLTDSDKQEIADMHIDAVASVNGKIGAVVLTASDVGAATAAQGALAESALQSIPDDYHDSTKQNVLTDADKQAIADLHDDAVDSVNGKTGAVVLNAADINDGDGNTVQADLNGINSELDETNSSIEELQKLNDDFESASGEAYTIDAPSGKTMCSVLSYGGKSVIWNQLSNVTNYTNGVTDTNAVANLSVRLLSDSILVEELQTNVKQSIGINTAIVCTSADGDRIQFKHYGSTTSLAYGAVSVAVKANTVYTIISKFSGIDPTVSGGVIVDYILLIDMTKIFGVSNISSVTDDMKMFCEKYAELHPEYNAGEIISADVDEIDVASADGTTIHTIPINYMIRSLPGYGFSNGTLYNEVDVENKKYIQRVGKVDLGTLSWTYYSSADMMQARHNGIIAAGSTALYTISCTQIGITTSYIRINGSGYTDAGAFKTAMSGAYVYYELAEYIETSLPFFLYGSLELIEVEDGSTITYHNENALPIPYKVKYAVKDKTVNLDILKSIINSEVEYPTIDEAKAYLGVR